MCSGHTSNIDYHRVKSNTGATPLHGYHHSVVSAASSREHRYIYPSPLNTIPLMCIIVMNFSAQMKQGVVYVRLCLICYSVYMKEHHLR